MADKPIKLVSNTQLYLDCEALLIEILDVTPNFPRDYKFTIGADMQRLSVKLVELDAAAYQDKEHRLQNLKDFKAKFETLKTLVRVAGERRWIKGLGRHARIIELMDAIGKQSTAWKNSLMKGSKPESES
jgi:hypothetical protein